MRAPRGSFRRTVTVAVTVLAVFASLLGVLATPASAQDRPTLRLGSSGDAVLVLETRLVELGFAPGTVDVSFDSATRSAVVAFQGAAGIGRDGIVGPVTWSKLDQGVTAPTPGPAPAPDPDPAPTPAPQPALLKLGSAGPEVRALEQRLQSLGYWVDKVDDRFESGTHHAVVALQKVAGLGRDGVVGPATKAALDAGTRPRAQVSGGHLIEIDLSRQVLMVVDNGTVSWIYDASTGKRAGTTPIGSHKVTRQIDGYRYAPLGTLYRPKYFYGGVAIHGYPSVPAWPASHGCVRVTYPAMDHLWATGVAPVGTTIKVYR